MAFEILARLGLNATGFQSGLKRAESSGVAFSNAIKSRLASAFSVSAVVAFGKSLTSELSKISDQAEQTRISIRGVQRIQNILSSGGLEFADITPLVSNLEKSADAAASGKSEFRELADIFEQMGLAASSFSLLEPEQQLLNFSKALQDFSEKDQARILRSVVGVKAGPKMAAALAQIADPKAGLSGLLSDEIVKEYEASGNRIERVFKRIKNYIAENNHLFRAWNKTTGYLESASQKNELLGVPITRQGTDIGPWVKSLPGKLSDAMKGTGAEGSTLDKFLAWLSSEKAKPAPQPSAVEEAKKVLLPLGEWQGPIWQEEKKKKEREEAMASTSSPQRFQQDISALQRIGEQILGGGGNNIQRDQLMELREIKRGVKELSNGTVFP